MSAAASPLPREDSAFVEAVAELARHEALGVARPIRSTAGQLLHAAGERLAFELIERLRGESLELPLDACIVPARGIAAHDLRTAAEAALERWPFFAQMAPVGRVRGMLLEAVAGVPLAPPVGLHLLVARAARPALFEHGVLMALLCAHLVREGGAPLHDISNAAAAGLLHDIGMLHIGPELLQPGVSLNGDELRPLYRHPQLAAGLVARAHEYPKEAARAILEHHEMLDGSGYPRGLAGDAISPLGRLLSLAEVVTAMFDGERQYPEQRVSLLLRMNPKRFDAALVPSIHRLLRALPAPGQGETSVATESIARLGRLAELLGQWGAQVVPAAGTLDEPRRALLESVGAQAETLQRMLYEAGAAPDQLGLLGTDGADDARLRVELWTLANELQWQLRSTAGQLRRRWGAPALAYPRALAAWLDQVEGLSRAA